MEDIKDNEIRIIGQRGNSVAPKKPSRSWWQKKRIWVTLSAIMLLVILLVAFLYGRQVGEANMKEVARDVTEALYEPEEVPFVYTAPTDRIFSQDTSAQSYTETRDTIISDIPLRIYNAVNATPSLHIGKLNTHDPNLILAFQAADVRKDNGKIVGACVYHGNIESRGLSKKGYVSILDGQITVGVAENSPLFEKAVEQGGDFFRQYPLLDNGFIVESVLKGKSIRRAICERGDEILVIETLTPESMHDFSQVLQDFQVKNAVYLVGSQYACGSMQDKNGVQTEWGEFRFIKNKNISYIVWKRK